MQAPDPPHDVPTTREQFAPPPMREGASPYTSSAVALWAVPLTSALWLWEANLRLAVQIADFAGDLAAHRLSRAGLIGPLLHD